MRLEDGTEYEFDAIVYATGFDAMTGPLNRIDIRGRGGQLLREKWADGPRTYLGLTSAGLPEPVHHHRPAEPVGAVQHAGLDRAARRSHRPDHRRPARPRRRRPSSPRRRPRTPGSRTTQELAEATLFPTADTWYMGANIPGKPRVFMPNLGFVGPYRAKCDGSPSNDYEGFTISARASRRPQQ